MVAAAWVIMLAVLCASSAAQDVGDETELARVQRDQARVALRLDSLRQKMDRLAARYEDEGRARNARLLREALKLFDEDRLLDAGREVERDLQRGLLSSVERQDALITSLDRVYAALRDRRDTEELSNRADLARRGVVELGFLARNQRDLLARTQATTDTPGELLREALSISEALRTALGETREAAGQLQEVAEALGEAELAEELARQQRRLSQQATPTAAAQAALEAVLAVLAEHLARPAGAGGGELLEAAEQARGEARSGAAAAAQAMARAREQLDASRTEPGDTTSGGVGPSDTGQDDAGPDNAGPGEADPHEAARTDMEAAADRLDEVRDALQQADRSLAAARNRAQARARVSAEDAARQGEQLQDRARRLEAVQPEEGPELLDRTRALIEELTRLAAAAQQEDAPAASSAAAAARLSLDELLAMLQSRAAGASDEERGPPDAQTLAELADSQEELRRQVRELMQRLQEFPDETVEQSMQRASASMSSAEEALRSGRTGEAGVREEEAAEQLERARDELAGERDRYEQLRQEEVLFRLGEEVSSLHDRQLAVNVETRQVQDEREGDRLGRRLRRAVARLAGTQRDLADATRRLRDALSEDGAVSFVFALDQASRDMARLVNLLGDERTGYVVQTVEDGVVQRLQDLLVVLDEELERRHEALAEADEQGAEGQGGMEGRQALVPPVAELLLIQRMEQMALGRLEQFEFANPGVRDEDTYADMERELLERWSLEHAEVTELFAAILEAVRAQGSPVPAVPELKPREAGEDP